MPPTVPPVVPPTVPPVPPTAPPPPAVPPPAVPPGPTRPPVPTPTAAKATVVRTFAVKATEETKFNATLATVTLPAGPTYRVTVFWGDGRTSVGVLSRASPTGDRYTITARHAYAEPGTYNVMVRVTADFKTVLSINTTAAVADARFYAGRVAQRLPAGRPFDGVVATIRDLNPAGGKAADYTATVDWGDGTTSAGQVRRAAAGKFEVVGQHAFAAAGRRTVTVTIRSASGTTAAAGSIFIIDPPNPARLGW